MKLLSFQNMGKVRLGWLQDDGKTVLSPDQQDQYLPQTMMEIISNELAARTQLLNAKDSMAKFDIDDIEIAEPLVPSSIFCAALNYTDHLEEVGANPNQYPIIFLRMARNHVAHRQPLWIPSKSDSLEWEGELAVIIGKGGRRIQAADAHQHIFGYSIYNEGTVRGYMGHSSQVGIGKITNNTAAFGPAIVTADEFGDPYQHEIMTTIDGEVFQKQSISLMLHKIDALIEYISSASELMPGDVICTGSPAGIGSAQKPPRFLRKGETLEVSISGIGTLSNPVQDEPI